MFMFDAFHAAAIVHHPNRNCMVFLGSEKMYLCLSKQALFLVDFSQNKYQNPKLFNNIFGIIGCKNTFFVIYFILNKKNKLKKNEKNIIQN